MLQPDFYTVVRNALENYHDLKSLEQSDLRALQALWPLPPALLNDLVRLPLRGVAVHYLLERALAHLAQIQPHASHLLMQRYVYEHDNRTLQTELGFAPATLHRHLNDAISKLATIIIEMEAEATTSHVQRISHQLAFVPPPMREAFVGLTSSVNILTNYLSQRLIQPRTPILITGLGGIGKTSLITQTLSNWVTSEAPPIERVLWVRMITPKEENQTERVIDLILSQIGQQLDVSFLTLPTVEQRLHLLNTHLLRYRQRFVIVIDNVESHIEHSGAIAFANTVSHIALIIIGSRRDPDLLQIGTSILHVQELSTVHAEELVTLESKHTLSKEDITLIVTVVGGHPLALLLVVAQLRRLPLEAVLASLGRDSQLANVLYNRIYTNAWQLLSPISKYVLIGLSSLPIQGTHLQRLFQLARTADQTVSQRQVEDAISELITLNLLQVTTSKTPNYSLHRLTYHFIEQCTGMTIPDDP